jgi:hypothetical protein
MDAYITTYRALGGWKAVEMSWNKEGFYEPYQTGVGTYKTQKEAVKEAKMLAQSEGLKYKEN